MHLHLKELELDVRKYFYQPLGSLVPEYIKTMYFSFISNSITFTIYMYLDSVDVISAL